MAGLLQTLNWTSQALGEPAPDEANIKVVAIGLNFNDVMIAMGVINGKDTLEKGTSAFGLKGLDKSLRWAPKSRILQSEIRYVDRV